MTDAVPEVSQVSEVKDEVKLNEYEFRVAMSCGGCSGAVTRALTNYNGGGHIKPKVGEAVAKNLVSEVAKQAPGPSPAA
ncbi:hypothetical protein H4S04_001779 [Coemansia sp. S16]|nr:hypothetical protein GGI14_002919 [Coemansia sp. S680]KAJ2051759.1 hypothetical protein H4S04_001779 [Coemansia sp. S16]